MTVTQLAPASAGLPAILARRVKGLMAELDLTQTELGGHLGVSRTAMSQRLRGHMEFALSELPILASVLGESIEYLLGLTDDRSPGRVAGAPGWYTPSDSNREPADSRSLERELATVTPIRRRSTAATGSNGRLATLLVFPRARRAS